MRCIPVDRPCASFNDGIAIIIDELTIDSRLTTVRLRIDPSGLTAELDQAYRQALQHAETGTRGPEPPAEQYFRRLANITLTDNLGTDYILRGVKHGDEDWRSNWEFQPAPPTGISNLTVATYVRTPPVSAHVIELDPQ